MGQQPNDQMQQDKQNQGNSDERQKTHDSFAAEQDEQLDNKQKQQNQQTASLYDDDGESLPEGMGEQWKSQGDTSEFE